MDTLVIDLNGGGGAPVKREDRDDQSPRVVERQYRNVAERLAAFIAQDNAEQDAWLAARMARDAEDFYRVHCGPIVAPTPLDVEYDGWTLRKLLWWDEGARRTENRAGGRAAFTPAQREAISAHWSAQLRAKVAAAKQTEREQVVCERDEDGE